MSLYQDFRRRGFDFFSGVPCSGLREFIDELREDRDMRYVPAPREDVALSLAVGAYFAGKKPLVYLQSSGLGHLINPITSLLTPYGIHVHLLISLRARPFEHFEMARISRELLALLRYEDFTLIETGGE